MIVDFSPEAREDLLGIRSYIQKDGESIAKKQIKLIINGIENLLTFPNMGMSVQNLVYTKTDLKYIIVKKLYFIVYEIKTDTISIVRILTKNQDFLANLGIGD